MKGRCHAKREHTAEVRGQKEIGGRLSEEDKGKTSSGNGRFWGDLSEGSLGAAQTAEEGSQIQPEPGPSGGCGGNTEVKIKAWTRTTKHAATGYLLSDDQGSEDNSGVAESHDLIASPKKKGMFHQKSADGDTGERHVPPVVQASVDDIEGVGRGNDGEGNNLASLSLGSDAEDLASLSFGSNTEYLA
jgi:hypothetical protein